MGTSIVARALDRLREWWSVADPDERIEGSGEVYLDPAYNGRYGAERELQRLAAADEGDDEAAPSQGRES
jgi:hypothetical protein